MFFWRKSPPPLKIDHLMVQVALVCDKMAHTIFRYPPAQEIEVLNVVDNEILVASVTVRVRLGPVDELTEEKVVTIYPVAGSPIFVEAEEKWYRVSSGSEGGVDRLTEIPNPFPLTITSS